MIFFSWTSEICLRTFWQYISEHHLLWRDCKNFGFFSSFCPQAQNPIVPANSKNIVLYCFCNSQVENNRIGTHNAPRQVSASFLWFSLVCIKNTPCSTNSGHMLLIIRTLCLLGKPYLSFLLLIAIMKLFYSSPSVSTTTSLAITSHRKYEVFSYFTC